jgi:formate hydrogenlyase subunit 6/NADH:ubiquinone oxidoreductase subunit I
MILDREVYFSNSLPKRVFLFFKKFFYILFRFLGRPNWGRLQAGEKVLGERQFLKLKDNDNGDLRCTSCQLCVEAWPTHSLVVELPGKKTFPVAPKSFLFESLKCINCDLCIDVCPEDAIEFSSDFQNIWNKDGPKEVDLIAKRASALS